MQAFQAGDFDAKHYINNELSSVSKNLLEKTVNNLSLRLQVLGTEVNAAFEDHIMQSLARLPRSLLEVDRMKREVTELSGSLSSMLTAEVIDKQREVEEATTTISKLHQTKTKLDFCQETLTKTAYLRENTSLIEAAFKNGDTAAIASEIFKMQQALKSIEGFEHHDQVAGSIATYEARLQDMVETECVDALKKRDKEMAQKHLSTLKKIGRLEEVMIQYTKQAVLPVVGVWKTFAKAHPVGSPGWEQALIEFLPDFYQKLEAELSTSRKYYHEVFQEDAVTMALDWFTMAQREVSRSQSEYFHALSLENLVDCYNKAVALAGSVTSSYLQTATDQQRLIARQSVVGAFAHLQEDFPALQQKKLLETVEGFDFVRQLRSNAASLTINQTLVADIHNSTTTLLHECQHAVGQCIAFTKGSDPASEMKQTTRLVQLLSDVLRAFVSNIQNVSDRLRTALFASRSNSPEPDSIPSPRPSRSESIVSAAEDGVKLKLTLLQHHTTAGVLEKVELFDQWVMQQVHPASTTGQLLFAEPHEELQDVCKFVEQLVFELLFSSVKSRLSTISEMPVWHEDEANALSSSSMHVAGTPLEYLRNIGDYLLSLPEVLGQARSGSDLTDDEHKWIQLVLQKSADYFVEQVIKIPKLSTAGLQQLATDVEYLENVIGYFEVEQPALKVLYLLVSTSDDGYAAVEDEVKQVLPSGSKLHALIAAKRFGTDQPPPPALPSPRESSPVPSQSSAVH